MTLRRYTGLTPSNVNKDAKYSVVSGPGGDEVRLVYRVNSRELFLLTTSHHPTLVDHVNEVKVAINGVPRGAFYINEFGDVLVPDGEGGAYWAGNYDRTLEFTYEGRSIGPQAPDGLSPGDVWPGPHVGVRYVLAAGGQDIRYELRSGNRILRVFLSDEVGADGARQTARRLAQIMGAAGGRFYINECGELFSPGRGDDGTSAIYLGNIDEDPWFSPPDDFPRP